mmetsp:Transcript_34099/g.53169  ORF Transcript_34099/g.53169 Transcript_34099/m.53169 type:complete len:208 (-) Transcript_34099:1417-2040(-)
MHTFFTKHKQMRQPHRPTTPTTAITMIVSVLPSPNKLKPLSSSSAQSALSVVIWMAEYTLFTDFTCSADFTAHMDSSLLLSGMAIATSTSAVASDKLSAALSWKCFELLLAPQATPFNLTVAVVTAKRCTDGLASFHSLSRLNCRSSFNATLSMQACAPVSMTTCCQVEIVSLATPQIWDTKSTEAEAISLSCVNLMLPATLPGLTS